MDGPPRRSLSSRSWLGQNTSSMLRSHSSRSSSSGGLDGFFLWQERLFRALYDYVRGLQDSDINFSMDVRAFRIQKRWLPAMFSRTLFFFYGALIFTVFITTVFSI